MRLAFDAALNHQPSSTTRPSVSFSKRGPRSVKTSNPASSTAVLAVDGQCWTCAASVARLNLRGADWAAVERPPRMRLTCADCVGGESTGSPSPLEIGGESGGEVPMTYRDTVSAAVDALQGIAPDVAEQRLVPLYAPRKSEDKKILRCALESGL